MSSKSASTPIPRPDQAPESNPVADFDIEAWRAGRTVPTRTVCVTNDPGAGTRLGEIEEQIETIEKDAALAISEGRKTPGRRAASTSTPEIDALRDEQRALLALLDRSWLHVRLRAANPHEVAKIDGNGSRVDVLAETLALVALIAPTADHPGVTQSVEEWHDTLDAIGVSQTLRLQASLDELTTAKVSPDFSRRVSELLNGVTSS